MRSLVVVLALLGFAPIAAVAQEAEPTRLREAAARALEAIRARKFAHTNLIPAFERAKATN